MSSAVTPGLQVARWAALGLGGLVGLLGGSGQGGGKEGGADGRGHGDASTTKSSPSDGSVPVGDESEAWRRFLEETDNQRELIKGKDNVIQGVSRC